MFVYVCAMARTENFYEAYANAPEAEICIFRKLTNVLIKKIMNITKWKFAAGQGEFERFSEISKK